MSRVMVASQAWGYWVTGNGSGAPRVGVGPTGGLKTLADAAVTIYAAKTGATPYGGAFVTDAEGRLPGWVEPGAYKYVEPLDGTTEYVEAVSAESALSVESSRFESAVNVKAPIGAFLGAKGDGVTDDSAAIQRAIDTLPQTGSAPEGGLVWFPAGEYLCASPIDLNGSHNIHLLGPMGSTGAFGVAESATRLIYSGTGARFIDGRLSWGLAINNFALQHSSAAFTGILLDLDGTDANNISAYARFANVQFLGDALDYTGTATGVSLKLVIDVTFTDCLWDGLDIDVKGSVADPVTSFSNCVKFFGGYWNRAKTAHIVNPGQQWAFYSPIAEPVGGSGAAAVCQFITANFRHQALTLINPGLWDGGPAGTWLTLRGEGTVIEGGLCGGSGGTSKLIDATHADNDGLDVHGVTVQGVTTGVALGAGKPNVDISANKWSSVTTKVAATDSAHSATSGHYNSTATAEVLFRQRSAGAWQSDGQLAAATDIYAGVDLADFAALGKVGPAAEAAVKLRDVTLYRNASTQKTLRADVPITLPTYTTATKPAAANVPGGTIIYVSDGGAGAVIQASTGAAWVNLG